MIMVHLFLLYLQKVILKNMLTKVTKDSCTTESPSIRRLGRLEAGAFDLNICGRDVN